MMLLRNVLQLVVDLIWHGRRSGRWLIAALIATLAISAVLAFTVKVAVPTGVYVLF